jgi:hypothetical protein
VSRNISSHEDPQVKPPISYNWLALSLVCSEIADVAAIAVYQKKAGVDLYYTKNQLSQADIDHGDTIGSFVRNAAKDKVNLPEFQRRYFWCNVSGMQTKIPPSLPRI